MDESISVSVTFGLPITLVDGAGELRGAVPPCCADAAATQSETHTITFKAAHRFERSNLNVFDIDLNELLK